jgi:hypothetical protein
VNPVVVERLERVLEALGPERVAQAEPTFERCPAGATWWTCFFAEALGTASSESARLAAEALGITDEQFWTAVRAFDAHRIASLIQPEFRGYVTVEVCELLCCTPEELGGVTEEFHQLVLAWLAPKEAEVLCGV